LAKYLELAKVEYSAITAKTTAEKRHQMSLRKIVNDRPSMYLKRYPTNASSTPMIKPDIYSMKSKPMVRPKL
jgi:hypothetical protein